MQQLLKQRDKKRYQWQENDISDYRFYVTLLSPW
jgi:hypothetical protein